ncbi:hypothetical protein FRC14_004701 [Serendipita sp. 396]|nr:hypothetical protein FRC14_004701 [Serendipita sp. 396]KAG8781553.1 hypothetical protein FRC15_008564 [Serendipita sp. 397]KAG8798828.1 hypothetical protein FRC16_006451 [Serendipita sp. 398]KAG8820187.1 hypothetical protein FRC19_009080 [Serendipita sp. 401]KAG8848678.1 hypothetical protein FRB91_010596 [Serendipita sp. 411]KAG8865085.1 hypothetical protein FRC20_009890 [Serendipita sp. 405]KAG9051839.1 hypothetical protein FS842_010951 [Serendipita sp. 407]
MGWWPFSSSGRNPSEANARNIPQDGDDHALQASQHSETVINPTNDETPSSATLKSLENARKSIEAPIPSSDFSKDINAFRETWKQKLWPNGVTSTPAFMLSGFFFVSSVIPSSLIRGTTPRLARVVLGGAFGTAGLAIRSGDQWNGASIATWWSLSHVILAALAKSSRKELAKRMGKPLPTSSPAAWLLTTATIATGAAYSTAI